MPYADLPGVGRGTMTEDTRLDLQTTQPVDVLVLEITVPPGGSSGWHSHIGPAVLIVKSGEFTVYDASDPTCTGRAYTAGQSFVDPGRGYVHIGRNESGTETAELQAMQFEAPIGGSPRIDAPAPGNCPF